MNEDPVGGPAPLPRTTVVSAVLLLAVLPLVLAAAVVGHLLNARSTAIENRMLVVIPDLDRAADTALTVALACWVALAVAVAAGAALMLLRRRAGRPLATGFGAALVLLPLCCGGLEGAQLAKGGQLLWTAPLRPLTLTLPDPQRRRPGHRRRRPGLRPPTTRPPPAT